MDPRDMTGRIVLVTGAASGIGKATAELFAAHGAMVVATDRDEIVGLDDERITTRRLDVTDDNDVASVIAEIGERHGRLDALVNNAGLAIPAPIDGDGYRAAWDMSIDVMLAGPMRLIRAALPLLRNSDAPRIVNVSSTEGVGGSAGNSPYTAAKHGLVGLTKSLAVEFGDEGITVNAVCPGPVRTGITAGIPDEMKDKFARRRVPLRRYADPIEIAHGIFHLAMPASSYITGHALLVDGGMTIKNN
ncbi:MAG: SDR family oxidoreductase [Ilumatobacteraceae bacterium]|nr:SDR family oxidoreductase [Ilumatobacteraceae bacterium]